MPPPRSSPPRVAVTSFARSSPGAAVPTSPELTERLAEAVAATGLHVETLPSGAGHDGVAIAAVAPIAMLFVRCLGGISHNPAEAVAEADVAVALDVLERFAGDLA